MKLAYGKKAQIRFQDEAEYYFALGFLASAKHTSLHWEHNEDQGAWGSEGRIHCYGDISIVPSAFTITGGRPGVSGRINCNEYVAQLSSTHHFVRGKCDQNVPLIRSTVPGAYQADFDRGLAV